MIILIDEAEKGTGKYLLVIIVEWLSDVKLGHSAYLLS